MLSLMRLHSVQKTCTDNGSTVDGLIDFEVVFALATEQSLVKVCLQEGATVEEAIALSGIVEKYPDEDLSALQTGIWGHYVERDALVKNGDRVELYRPLLRDPRDARRELARAGLTMRETSDG